MTENMATKKMRAGNSYANGSVSVPGAIHKKESMFPFYLVLGFLFFEYGRPQSLIPFLRYLHLPALIVILLGLSLVTTGKMYLKDRQTVLFLLFIGEMVLHGPLAVNNYWAFQVFYWMTVTFLAYIAIVNIVDNDFKYQKLIKFWLAIYIFVAIIGVFYRGRGVGGFLGDENDFCMALNMILPFALFGAISARKGNEKIYFFFLILLFLFVVILTQSRGGFVGLASVSIYCWLRSNRKIILGVLMGFLVGFALLIAPPSYWNEVRSISTENTESNPWGTGAQRMYSWNIGWNMFLDHPVIGVGQGNYPWNVERIENKLGVQWHERSLAGRAAHSLYFTLLPELGVIGVVLYGAMIFFTLKDLNYIKKAAKTRKDLFPGEESKKLYYLALALEGSLVAFLASSVFISTLYYPNFWILCGFVVSLKKVTYAKCGDMTFVPKKLAIKVVK